MNRNDRTRHTPHLKRHATYGAALLLVLLTLSACSSRAALNLDPESSGTAEVVVNLDPVFVRYYRDLAGSVGGDQDIPVFDLGAVAARFEEEAALTLLGARVPAPGRLELQLAFDELTDLAEDERFGRILTYSRDDAGSSRLAIRLGTEDVPFLLSLAGLGEGSPVELLLPPPGGDMSAEEYREYLIWALEEYEEPPRLRQILNGAAVTVTVATPEAVDSVTNGGQLGPREARFRIQLLPLLTGEHEGVYELVY